MRFESATVNKPSAQLHIKEDIHVIFILISPQGASNEYPQHMFEK